jgi:hypothetical protein
LWVTITAALLIGWKRRCVVVRIQMSLPINIRQITSPLLSE